MSPCFLQIVTARADAAALPGWSRLNFMRVLCRWTATAVLCMCAGVAVQAQTQGADTTKRQKASTPKRETPSAPKRLDRTMQPQVGKASIYADMFANRKMANGKRMDLNGDNAASKTLPLGTKALVTNLQTGKSAVVTIEDRGPYIEGRIVDLSPATAEKIGLEKKQGIAPVEVRPLELPPAEGTVASAEADE